MHLKLLSALTLAALLSSCAGLSSRSTPLEVWPDMKRQHKFRAQSASTSAALAAGRLCRRQRDHRVAEGTTETW